MSLSDRSIVRKLSGVALVVSLAFAAGCTVRPLYSDAALQTGSLAGGETMKSALASVAVKPPTNRVELEVRNHLIFLLGGDGGTPATPKYMVEQSVSAVTTGLAIVQETADSEPTSRQVTVRSIYTLKAIDTGNIIGKGDLSMSASFDVPAQEFAVLRAERDAQNRAAREVAELLRHSIAGDLSKVRPQGS